MLTLTRKTDYALVALAALAEPSETGGQASARELAGRYGMPLPLLMNVLKRLQRAKLIESTRGAKGGYRLAVDPQGLRLTRVIEAIEGPMRVTVCCDAGRETTMCMCQVSCPITGSIQRLNEQIHGFLGQFTLADLMAGVVDNAGGTGAGLLVRPRIAGLGAKEGAVGLGARGFGEVGLEAWGLGPDDRKLQQ